jgi:hypothetical protein
MYAIKAEGDTERRKRLSPEMRNEIVRDIVSTMYAHTSHPNKDFCTSVAKQLVHKYPFMKDTGTNVSAHVSNSIIIAVWLENLVVLLAK